MSSAIRLWACAARCQDQTEREVIGLYRGERSILISRPWCSPSGVPALQIANRRLFPLLSSLVGVADYHSHEGVWYGEVATDWHAVAALSGMSRNTVSTSLQELMRDGFIYYNPAWGRVSPALIRVFPYNAKTGLRVFQVDATWLRAFIVNVEPKLALYDAVTEGKSIEFAPVTPERPMRFMAAKITNAPVFVPASAQHEPNLRAREEHEEIYHTFLMKLEGVAGLEDLFNLLAGNNPRIKSNPLCTGPDSGLMRSQEVGLMQGEGAQTWRSDSWSQGGVEVRIVDVEAAPAATELGAQSSWAITPDVEESAVESEAERSARAPAEGSWPKNEDTEYNHDAAIINKVVVATSPTAGSLSTGASAPSAPPAAAPPAASAQFLLRSSKRQLQPGEVAAIYRIRGKRISDAVRDGFTTSMVSCIETYERLAGVPFCERDLPFLERALTLTSHRYVLSGIRDTSRFPKENPGNFIVRDGMSHVFNYIEKTSAKHAKPRGRKDRTTSGMTAEFATKLSTRRRANIAAEKSATSPASPLNPPGIVSENSPAPAPETTEKGWPR